MSRVSGVAEQVRVMIVVAARRFRDATAAAGAPRTLQTLADAARRHVLFDAA
jgi:hypothetical protein